MNVIMKNLILILFFFLPFGLFAQSDTQRICHSGPVTLVFDTTWNHSIMESDLILHVEIQKTMMVTQAGSFQGKVLQVIKGEFNDSNFSIYLELIEFSIERSMKRLSAICPPFDETKYPYRCYVGFKKNYELWNSIKDPVTKDDYGFFMSQKDLENELRIYLQKFVVKKLLPFYLEMGN
jgi:hypothetical protein